MKTALTTTLALALGCFALPAQPEAPAPGPQPPARFGAPPRQPRPLPLAILEKYDANADGKLDEQERAELHQQVEGAASQRPEGRHHPPPPRGPRDPGRHFGPPKEILDQYDLDKDGRLDETEHAAVKADVDAGKLQPPPWPHGPGRGPTAPPPPPSPTQILEKHDLDHDGKLDETELTSFLKSQKNRFPSPH